MRISLFHTTTFRTTAFATFVFILLAAVGLHTLYWSMLSVIDRQIDGALDRDVADLAATHATGGLAGLRRTVADRASPHDDALRVYVLREPGGITAGNLPQWPEKAPKAGEEADIPVPHATRAARVRTLAFADGSRLLVGRSLSERDNFIHIFEESAIGVLIANLLLGGLAATILALYSRRRLERINATTEEVLGGNLSGRIEVGKGGDEYDILARNINAMLDRIEELIDTVRGVSENIAHDLRTPLNRLRGRLEVALMHDRTPEEYRAVIERAIAHTETIVATFNSMLKVARIEAGALKVPRDPVVLNEVVEELLDLYDAFADENGVNIACASAPESMTRPLYVLGDGHLISQAAGNLLDNAVKYAPCGSRVTIAAARLDNGIALIVADEGRGIPAEKREAILQRFVRLESGRDQQGYGLGLSFVAAVARWHGAKLQLEDNQPGLKATLLFPPDKMIGQG